jgi:hypothetical protein
MRSQSHDAVSTVAPPAAAIAVDGWCGESWSRYQQPADDQVADDHPDRHTGEQQPGETRWQAAYLHVHHDQAFRADRESRWQPMCQQQLTDRLGGEQGGRGDTARGEAKKSRERRRGHPQRTAEHILFACQDFRHKPVRRAHGHRCHAGHQCDDHQHQPYRRLGERQNGRGHTLGREQQPGRDPVCERAEQQAANGLRREADAERQRGQQRRPGRSEDQDGQRDHSQGPDDDRERPAPEQNPEPWLGQHAGECCSPHGRQPGRWPVQPGMLRP